MRTPPRRAARLTLASCLLASTAAASPAPLDRSRFLLTVDRLFGLSRSRADTSTAGSSFQDLETSTGFSLLSPTSANPYSLPLLGLHYSLLPSFTVGAGLSFLRVSGKANLGSNDFTVPHGPRTTFVLAPRVGYLLSLSGMASIWLRSGLTYFVVHEEHDGGFFHLGNTLEGLALSADPLFVFTPFDHLGVTLGPVIDWGVRGLVHGNQSRQHRVRLTNLGLQAGLLGAF